MTSIDSSSSEDVDFEQYRKEYESAEHWKLRRSFMEKFWDEIETEDEILCCAQLFVNIEFLGCRYSKEVMEKIAQMSAQVPEIVSHRMKRKNSLKRSFVQANDAVAAKYNKNDPNKTLARKTTFQMFVKQQDPEPAPYQPQASLKQRQNETVSKDIILGGINATKILDSDEEKEVHANSGWDDESLNIWKSAAPQNQPLIKFSEAQKAENLRQLLRDVILFENEDESDTNFTINKTTAMMRKVGKLELKFDASTLEYLYLFDDQIVGLGRGDTKKLAKKAADEDFVRTLRENCFTVRSKLKFFSAGEIVQKGQQQPEKVSSDNQQLNESNLGFKMLKSLGWKGGSLGSSGTGIIDPINLEIKIGRLGLGSDTNDFDPKYFRNLLNNFKNNQLEYDLVFASDFTKEERAKVHQIASQLNLKTKSYGKGDQRHLVISSKLSPQMLRQKLLEGDRFLREKYEILPPKCKR